MLKKLQTLNFAKFQKFQLNNLVDLKKMLQNAYLLAKIGADTAENERNFPENLPKIGNYPTGPLALHPIQPKSVGWSPGVDPAGLHPVSTPAKERGH